MTHRVLASLVMPTVRVLPVMPWVLVPLVMQWWMLSLAMLALMVRVLQGMLRLTVPLVMMTMRVLQVMILVVGPRMGRYRRFWAWTLATPGRGPVWALVVRWLAGAGGVGRLWCRGTSSAILAEGADCEGGVGDGVFHVGGVCSCRCCTGRCRG